MTTPIGADRPGDGPAVGFVLEQHLGHRTYGQNLRAAVEQRTDIRACWIDVDYDVDAWWQRLPLPHSVRGFLAGRHQVRDGIRRAHADVHVFNTQVPAAIGGARARRAPYVVVTDITPLQYDAMAAEYEHRPDRGGPVSRWKHAVNRRVYTGARTSVAWSTWAARSIVDDYGVPGERVEVIPPGVDMTAWSSGEGAADDAVRVLFVGGDFERKGGDLLLDAFASLPEQVELTLVTKSSVAPTARVSVVADLVPNDDRLRRLYATSDIFVLPSRAEAFGIAATEAAASGLASVVSDAGGLTDIVEDGTTGYVVPVGDARSLAAAIGRLVDDPLRRAQFAGAARRRAEERFDAARNATRLLEVIRSAAAD